MRLVSPRKSVLTAAMVIAAVATPQPVEEYHVKAAFVINFAKFTEWPMQAFKTPADALVFCVLGQDQLASSLREAVNGHVIAGRPANVREVTPGQAVSDCNILFVGESAAKRFRSSYNESTGILTVGETPGFAADGGVINLKLENGRVRFEINVAAAERQQLHISSKLLSLAELVKK
jgi:hypothetical protein